LKDENAVEILQTKESEGWRRKREKKEFMEAGERTERRPRKTTARR
jgi:hypothetical protein